jgi:hypothetical protein
MPLPNFEEKKFQSCKLMDDKEEEEEDPVSFPPPSFKTDDTLDSQPNKSLSSHCFATSSENIVVDDGPE